MPLFSPFPGFSKEKNNSTRIDEGKGAKVRLGSPKEVYGYNRVLTYLDLSSELLHLPPGLRVLSPHQLDDCGREGQAHQDVDHAQHHVRRAI